MIVLLLLLLMMQIRRVVRYQLHGWARVHVKTATGKTESLYVVYFYYLFVSRQENALISSFGNAREGMFYSVMRDCAKIDSFSLESNQKIDW